MKKINKNKVYFYLAYTALFAVFMAAILYFYYSNGKAIVHNSNDGFKQNYRALLYISNHYKKILNNIFVEHTFVIPQWDFVIGEGADILETFHYYGLGDPINLLSVFFNESNLYLFHDFSIFLRMYLSGLIFSCLCFYKKHNKKIVVLAGSLLYAYSSYAFRVMTNYIYFLNPLMYFPLVILGIEKIIDENKGRLLTIAVALSAITSIYFFYMIVIATVMYVAIRILINNSSVKIKLNLLLQIFEYSLFGVLIASVIFMPSAYSMLSNSRTAESVDIALFYGKEHYVGLFRDLIFNGYRGAYYGGYSVLGFFAIITVLLNRKNKSLFWLLSLAFIIMSLPIFGSLFNAMTYITERYEFIIGLLVIYCVVTSYDELTNLSSNIIIYFLFLVVYLIVGIVDDPSEKMTYFIHFIIGTVTLVCLRFIKKSKLKELTYLMVVLATLSFTIAYKYLPNYWNHANTNGSDIVKLTSINSEEPSILDNINDDSFYRYSGTSLEDNVCVNHSKSSTGYYWSVANNSIADYRTLFGFHDISNFYITDYDNDYILNTLSGIKYYFVKDGDLIPYGYELLTKYDNYDLYVNTNSLPLIYAYDSSISEEEFNKLSILDRQEVITSRVVTNDKSSGEDCFVGNKVTVSYNLETSGEITLTENTIETQNSSATIELNFSSSEKGEYYFIIEGITPNREIDINVKCGTVSENILTKNKNSHAYGGRHSFAVNLGYHEGIDDKVIITIPGNSRFVYSNYGIYCLPLKDAETNLKQLNCVSINNLNIKDNCLEANINVDKDKFLVFSIPNYDGWEAQLDGESIALNKYNIMYMGFKASEGTHQINLVYKTPLLGLGAVTSLLSIIGFIIFEKRKL